eukprot:jgi/Mesvir1/24673/Mv21967-RA.1
MAGFGREGSARLIQGSRRSSRNSVDNDRNGKPDIPALTSNNKFSQSSRVKLPGDRADSFTPRSSLSYHTTIWQDAEEEPHVLENVDVGRPKERPVSRAWAVLRTALWLGYFNQGRGPPRGRSKRAPSTKQMIGNPKAGWLVGEADPKLLKVSNAAGIGMRIPDKFDIDTVETKALLEELAEEEELVKKKRAWGPRLKRNFWWLFQILLSIVLGVTFLLIIYYIQGVETEQIVDTALWKWASLLLSLSLGRLLISTVVLPLMYLIERLFVTKNRVIYYMASLKNPVINLFWMLGVLIVWVVLFEEHDLAGAYKAVVTVLTIAVVTSFLLIVETVSVKVLASRFHLESYFARMQESVLSQRILMKLSQFVEQPKRVLLPQMTSELHPTSAAAKSGRAMNLATASGSATDLAGKSVARSATDLVADSDNANDIAGKSGAVRDIPELSLRQPSLLEPSAVSASPAVAPASADEDAVSPVGAATSSAAAGERAALSAASVSFNKAASLNKVASLTHPVSLTQAGSLNKVASVNQTASLSQAEVTSVIATAPERLSSIKSLTSFKSLAYSDGFVTPPASVADRTPSFSSFVSLDKAEGLDKATDPPGASLGALPRGPSVRERGSFEDARRLGATPIPSTGVSPAGSSISAFLFPKSLELNGGESASMSAARPPDVCSGSVTSQGSAKGRLGSLRGGSQERLAKGKEGKEKEKENDKDKDKEADKLAKELEEEDEELANATHHGLPAETLERLMQFVREQKITTEVSLIGVDGRGGGAKRGAVNEVSNGRRARALGYLIYERVFGGRRYIREKDLAFIFDDAEFAKRAFGLMSKAAVTEGRVYHREFVSWVYAVYQERRALALTMRDTNTVMDTLHRVLVAVTIIVGVVIGCVITRVDVLSLLVGSSALLLSWVFIFGNSMRMLFEALLFLFLVHPFDVGDRVEIEDKHYIVSHCRNRQALNC